MYAYCGNRPLLWKDPHGLDFVVFIHGTLSNPYVFDKEYIGYVKRTLGATTGHHVFGWSGGWGPNSIIAAGCELAQKLKQIREKYPNAKIHIVGHSNGGNVAIAAAQAGGPVDTIIRLGSPYFTQLPKDLHRGQWKDLVAVPSGVKVIDFTIPTTQFSLALRTNLAEPAIVILVPYLAGVGVQSRCRRLQTLTSLSLGSKSTH